MDPQILFYKSKSSLKSENRLEKAKNILLRDICASSQSVSEVFPAIAIQNGE